MDAQVSTIVASITGGVTTLAAAWIGYLAQSQKKKLARLEKTLEKYKDEIKSRMYLERVAMRLIREQGICASERAAQSLLREKTRLACDLTPAMSPGEVGTKIIDAEIDRAFEQSNP
jgi:hypothetical protein